MIRLDPVLRLHLLNHAHGLLPVPALGARGDGPVVAHHVQLYPRSPRVPHKLEGLLEAACAAARVERRVHAVPALGVLFQRSDLIITQKSVPKPALGMLFQRFDFNYYTKVANKGHTSKINFWNNLVMSLY